MFDFLDSTNIGKTYNGFLLLSIDDLPDYKSKGVYLRHKRTGLEVYHIVKDDKENLFAFAFRTIAKDNMGTAHIMEHSTLCGSEKYPLKEPFSTLVSTSLNTFLNALTYPDKTVYPGASVVRDDYFNMMDVYADAVFFPKLDHATFIQEGHRLEMDDKGKLSIQGVVYNEMKGNFSSFMSVAFDQQINAMFPGSYPSYESGGDPLDIPNLTYQQFLDFHQKFYNPDNCLLFLYGDIPTSDQLDFLNERFIDRIEKKYGCTKDVNNADSKLPLITEEIRQLQALNLVNESKEVRAIAPDTGATGEFVTMNWYTGQADMEKYYLSEVLSGNDGSPLCMALKESNLGDDVNVGNFGQFREEFFMAGLAGVKKEDEQKVYDLVEKTLKDLYENGVDQDDIDSAVMGIDFNLREVNRYWGPVSIQFMENALKGWANGKSCAAQLSPITEFEKVKAKIRQDKDYTKNLIKKYFIDNKVTVKFVAEPTAEYFAKRNEAEEKLIAKLEANLDKVQLKKDLDELHAYQQHVETPEETACIPTTKLSSLDPKIDLPHTDLQFVTGADGSKVPLFVSREDTNGLFYVDLLFPFDRLEPEYLQHMPFLSNVITNMGWNGKKWDQCISDSACLMGDIWGRLCTGAMSDCQESRKYNEQFKDYGFTGRQWLGISCKALTSMAEESLRMFSEIVTTMSFDDEKRFASLVQELKAEKKAGLVGNGRDYCVKRARALTSPVQAMNEVFYGVSQLTTVSQYKKNRLAEILKTFKYIYEECRKAGAIIHITADEDSLKKILPMMEGFAKESKITKLLPARKYTVEDFKPFIAQEADAEDSEKPQLIEVKSQTGYAAVVSKAADFMTKEAAAETIFASWFSMHTLWDKIRTTGGAYGAGSWNDNIEKTFIMATYRDPTPEKSVEVYLESLKELSESEIPAEDIEKTIVSCYGDAIVPVCPKDRGARSFESMLFGNPQEFKQERLNKIFAVTPEDVQKTVTRLYQSAIEENHKVIFCDKSKKNYGNIINIPL